MKNDRSIDLGLTGYEELFMSTEERLDAKKPKVEAIPLADLTPFRNHPFKVKEDEEMAQLMRSIADAGVLSPALARPLPDGGYELISGHRRLAACKALGMDTMPVIIRDLTDEEAVITMVDSNLQREHILPSEKAFAYKMKMEALSHQGKTSRQVGEKCPDVKEPPFSTYRQTPFQRAEYAHGAGYCPPRQWRQHPGRGHKSRQGSR